MEAEIRFRLYDGLDVGPLRFPLSTTVLGVKEALLDAWPKARPVKQRCAAHSRCAGETST